MGESEIENINQDNQLNIFQDEFRQLANNLKSLLTEDKNFMAVTEKINEKFKKGYNILTNKDYLLEYNKF